MPRRAAVGTLLLGAMGIAVGVHATSMIRATAHATDLHAVRYVGSGQCRRCHSDHYQSWARTFHRTMTQTASPQSILGNFEGANHRYGGLNASFNRFDGRYLMVVRYPDGRSDHAVVERTVGSRRIQQYLARRGDLWFRLPLAWNVEEGSWMHMNSAFLTPDPAALDEALPVGRTDYNRHVTRWNDNCIFCHNVAPNPGRSRPSRSQTVYRSEVAELGVACEACHGPGETHVRANTDPLRRLWVAHAAGRDPTIVNPSRLPPSRRSEICGRCHGQRITPNVERFMRDGDPFVPGDRLADYSTPLSRGAVLEGERVFTSRFWPDGTARLTAYEYQGLRQSPCHDLTCTQCHGMHEGDPRGQLRPGLSSEGGGCADCHRSEVYGERAHSHHASVECVDCHMPRIVYGIVAVHRSHRIENPDPFRTDRPDACTLCHTDRTRRWAQRAMSRYWPDRADTRGGGDEPDRVPAAARAALAGDPIERAVAVAALGDDRGLAHTRDRERRMALLTHVMLEDRYPAVRRIARRAAARLDPRRRSYQAFNPEWSRPERTRYWAGQRTQPGLLPLEWSQLHPSRDGEEIFIGE